MENIAIEATKRTILGKRVKTLRQAGKLPGILYGHNTETAEIEIKEKDFSKAFKQAGESTLVNLVMDGKTTPVLIYDVQHHYLNGQPLHVDFYAVNMTEKLKVRVPIQFTGESQAVKGLGGTLLKNLSDVEVECLPADIPKYFEIDISSLNTFEDAIRIQDLKVSDKVTILAKPDEVIVNVAPPRTEEEMKELSEKPVVEDVTLVEGVLKPEETPEAVAGDEKAEKPEKKEEKK
ncbi:MAG: 50S ribosomal protein L25 [Candidatus Doudnabacteria bacterium]